MTPEQIEDLLTQIRQLITAPSVSDIHITLENGKRNRRGLFNGLPDITSYNGTATVTIKVNGGAHDTEGWV